MSWSDWLIAGACFVLGGAAFWLVSTSIGTDPRHVPSGDQVVVFDGGEG